MTCKDCAHYDVCGKKHRREHPDESGAEYSCKNFAYKAVFTGIVRCKYCVFVKDTKIKLNGKPLRNCDLYKRPCRDDDFCSRGVREDEQDGK